MLRRKLGVAALVLSSFFGLTNIAAARDHDRYDDRYYDRGYHGDSYSRGMNDHQRRKWEERREREARKAERRLEREQRRGARNGYNYGPYRNNNPYGNNGYYDRYGNWHSYGR
jgi:hypothetical protein